MVSFSTVFVGKSFLFQGQTVKAVGETDSGNVKVKLPDGSEVWTWYGALQHIDGLSKLFTVYPLPTAAAA